MIRTSLHSSSCVTLTVLVNHHYGPDPSLKETLYKQTPSDFRPQVGMLHMTASSQSGIHRLPSETLSYIFLHVVHEYDESPLTISHICSRWRKVSISTGALWTSIKLSLPYSSSQLAYLQTWLSRSKSYPLDILLDFRDEDWNWEEDDHAFTPEISEEIISVLRPHSKRWRHVELFTDTWAPIYTFLDLTRNITDLPILKSVALSRCNAYFARKGELFKPTRFREPISLFGGACLPSLRELSLVGVHVNWQTSSLRNLVELEFKFHAYDVMPTLPQFINILTGCPELERLSIVGWGPKLDVASSTHQPVPHIISMPKLLRLCFGFVDVDYAVLVLSLFHLPALCELELEDVASIVDPMGPSDASALLELLGCSTVPSTDSCCYPLHQVECLELRSLRSSETVFANFLRRFVTLEKINLSDADSALLSALGPQNFAPGPVLAVEGGGDTNHTSKIQESRRPSFVSLSGSLAPCPHLSWGMIVMTRMMMLEMCLWLSRICSCFIVFSNLNLCVAGTCNDLKSGIEILEA
ncbi:hypothetical protein BDP27DRAFT_62398 [Rhodocollybia butyracea]|uniref:F-box domain-containing protein n=1 Tax=Rhodocollybia butyracea TaxID=206335 RepID=A0A9P5PNY4_9AGAR|nr:hypothetical protein BDP27DRAFT_62398 [Rhodocollybia butyracea]